VREYRTFLRYTRQSSPQHPGSSSLLVIQIYGSQIATSEERVANWGILITQQRNEHSFRDQPSHYLVFTKNGEEPTSFTLVRTEASLIVRLYDTRRLPLGQALPRP
jgi:hypothetical protein